MKRNLSIIIPCYNEEDGLLNLRNRLYPVLDAIKKDHFIELIFVDDGSIDDTNRLLHDYFKSKKDIKVKIVKHEKNKNLGAALRTGFSICGCEVICTMDSDCTYDPENLPLLLDVFYKSGADIVTASPYHPKGGVENAPKYRIFLSNGVTIIYRIITGSKIYTFTSMYRIYKRDVIFSTKFYYNNFLAVTELMIYPLFKKYRVVEVPMVLHSRQFGVSKMKVINTIKAHLGFILKVIKIRLGARI